MKLDVFQVLSLITLICAIVACCGPAGWVQFVAVMALFKVALLLILHMMRMMDRVLVWCVAPVRLVVRLVNWCRMLCKGTILDQGSKRPKV